MSKREGPGRHEAHDTGSVHQRLARLLDTPPLARIVPHLAPEILHRLIRYRGLDACGELVASATPKQLTSVLDLDLWRASRAGRDEGFDEERFGEWLELLMDIGESVAARTVAAIDETLVITGLARYVRVFAPATFAPSVTSDDKRLGTEGTSSGSLACEVGGYVVRATRPEAWEAIVTLLVALDAGHRDYFHAVMRGCRKLSNSTPEVDGLDDLLFEPAQLLHDVAIEREHRRSQQGYLSPAEARAFLQTARERRVVAAYFRAADDEAPADSDARAVQHAVDSPASSHDSASIDAVVELLAEAGLLPERSRTLLEGAAPDTSRLTRMRRLMEHVRDTDDTAYLTRSRELAFLANALMAGCSVQSRPFTPLEASDAAVAVCNLGLEHWPEALPGAILGDHNLVAAFEAGWAVLHRDVSLFVAERVIGTLTDLRHADVDIQRGLHVLRRELMRQRDRGHAVARASRARGDRYPRHSSLGQAARPAGRVSDAASGFASDPRRSRRCGQRNRVRVHLDARPAWRCSSVRREAPRASASLIMRERLGDRVFFVAMAAAIAYWPVAFRSDWTVLAATDVFILVALAYDFATRRHVASAYLWGGSIVVAGQALRLPGGTTEMWRAVARQMLQ